MLAKWPWAGSLHGVVAGAARGCELGILRQLHETHEYMVQQQGQGQQGQTGRQPSFLAAAASSPTPDWEAKAQWLLQQGHPRDARCSGLDTLADLPDAAERVGWMRRERVAFLGTASLTQAAACRGHVPLLSALLDCGAVFSNEDVRAAARQGHMAWLQLLHERGGSIPHDAIHGAARSGHTELVQWLWGVLGLGRGDGAAGKDEDWQLPEWLQSSAAASGRRELIEWVLQLQAEDWEWRYGVFGEAASSGCVSFVEWLLEQGCPMQVRKAMQRNAGGSGSAATPLCRCNFRLCRRNLQLRRRNVQAHSVVAWAPAPTGAAAAAADRLLLLPLLRLRTPTGHRPVCPRRPEWRHGHAQVAQAAGLPLRHHGAVPHDGEVAVRGRPDGRLFRQPAGGVGLVP